MPKENNASKLRIPAGEELMTAMEAFGCKPPEAAPLRKEGIGPYRRFVIRNAILIDGTGAPPYGPIDIVIENDRIKRLPAFGYSERQLEDEGDYEIDATGKYVMPGFVDAHVHIGACVQGVTGPVTPAEYVFKLWMAHGVTTVREAGAVNGLKWTLDHEKKSAANEITAPRIFTYPCIPPEGYSEGPSNPDEVKMWLDEVVKHGVTGVKLFGGPPHMCKVFFGGAKERDLRSCCHNTVTHAAKTNTLDQVEMGLTSMEHSLGLTECLTSDTDLIQDYPLDYNWSNEQARALQDMTSWLCTDPGGPLWNRAIDIMLEHDFTIVPTLAIWEQGRDVQRALWAEWHDQYTLPALWRFFMPNPGHHWAFYKDWTTTMEIVYSKGFRIWMDFVNDYKIHGGRICTGSDSGFGLKLYGFDFVREFEMLQEAGFHPLEVIRAATLKGAQLLGVEDEIGTIEVGKKADFVIVDENPLDNFKVLYGTGHMKYNSESGEVERVGGIRWTIKDGIIYDAKQLLADVADMVVKEKEREAAQESERN